MSEANLKENIELGKAIKNRRQELGLTIAEAANRAKVGIKTWYRYEIGEPMRGDKIKGVCRALNWKNLPNGEVRNVITHFDVNEYRKDEYWSEFLYDIFGANVAVGFVHSCKMLEEMVNDEFNTLARMPKGTHIGALDSSMLKGLLPEQFLMDYDYNFIYRLKTTLRNLAMKVSTGQPFRANSVLEELVLYMIVLISEEYQDFRFADSKTQEKDDFGQWMFAILGDMDVVMYLYSEAYVEEDEIYHFKHWTEKQFFA